MNALLEHQLRERPERPFLYEGDRVVSYAVLHALAGRYASWLQRRGIGAGDRVAVHLPNCVDAVAAMFAAARLGAVFVNIHRQWKGTHLQRAVEHCGARALFTVPGALGTLAAPAGVAALAIHGAAADRPGAVPMGAIPAAPPPLPVSSSPDDLAGLLFTSGSTGFPKAVMISNANLVDGAVTVASYLGNGAEDRLLGLLPMSFDYGLNQLVTMLLVGGSLALQRFHLPSEVLKTVLKRRLTGMALVPTLWSGMVRYLRDNPVELPSLRYVTNSGGSIPLPILEESPRAFPGKDLYLMYGTTEAFRSTYLPPSLFSSKMGSIGRAVPGVTVYVVNDEGGLCAPGERGEIVHGGKLVSRGYWGDRAGTEKIIRDGRDVLPGVADGKVLCTGDLACRDDDGFLWFVGRKDQLIKCSGFRISPHEVEKELCLVNRDIEAVAFAAPDEELGQAVHAAVAGASAAALGVESILSHCRNTMPSYMVPRKIYLWEEDFPRTPHGKTDRAVVVGRCAGTIRDREAVTG